MAHRWSVPDALALPGEPTALFVSTLLRRLASSPEAAAATLAKGRAFLLRLDEAQRSGATLSRVEFMSAFGHEAAGGPAQQVLPFWFRGDATSVDLARRLPVLDRVANDLAGVRTRDSAKFEQAVARLGSRQRTIVFTEYATSAKAVFDALGERESAVLVSGAGAWVSSLGKVRPETAWEIFRDGEARLGLAPRVLVLTPVGAEGLNLQHASQVIHWDLPWAAARLEQRIGRVDRIGGAAIVDVHYFVPQPEIEAALQTWSRLETKAALSALAPSSEPSGVHGKLSGGGVVSRSGHGSGRWLLCGGDRVVLRGAGLHLCWERRQDGWVRVPVTTGVGLMARLEPCSSTALSVAESLAALLQGSGRALAVAQCRVLERAGLGDRALGVARAASRVDARFGSAGRQAWTDGLEPPAQDDEGPLSWAAFVRGLFSRRGWEEPGAAEAG